MQITSEFTEIASKFNTFVEFVYDGSEVSKEINSLKITDQVTRVIKFMFQIETL